MANTTLQAALARFGIVTVLEPTFQKLDINGDPIGTPFTLDTLRISNFTEEGPRKTAKGGLNAETIFRFGKTARLEMEDVVGRIEVLEGLFNARLTEAGANATKIETFIAVEDQKVFELSKTAVALTSITVNTIAATGQVLDPSNKYVTITNNLTAGDVVVVTYTHATFDTLAITDSFAGYFSISGRTFVVDQITGARDYINIFVHKFLPDGLLNLTMESEGDFGVFNIAGELFTNDCGVFYELTKGDQPQGC